MEEDIELKKEEQDASNEYNSNKIKKKKNLYSNESEESILNIE